MPVRSEVAVRLASGGLGLIEVADDGCGMAPAEMKLALERHATSKLPGEAIEEVASFGFRGEALPSIASVSRMTLESRVARPTAGDGWRIEIDHGEMLGEGPAALPPGTRVRIEDLFGKVPARRKFLRSPRAEYAACLDAVKRLAMARSDVAFTLDHDGRRILSLRPAEAPARVAELLAHELDRHGVGIDCERHGLRLTGVISLPTFNRGLADQQYLFVNGRPVKDRLLVGALRAAYRDLLARDRHPIAALFVEVPSGEVDINVHPAKTEVRFRDPAAVRGLIVGGLARRARPGEPAQRRARAIGGAGHVDDQRELCARLSNGMPPGATAVREEQQAFSPVSFSPHARGGSRRPPRSPTTPSESRAGKSPRPISSPRPRTGSSSSTSMPRTNAWCSSGCAPPATEAAPASQALLIPETVELDEVECDRIEGAAAELAGFGLEVERFGPTAILVRAIPAALGKTDIAGLIADLAAEIAELGGPLSLARQARPRRRDHRLPRLGPRRPRAQRRRDERAAARNGSHPALGPVQPRPPDLGETRAFGDIEKLFGRR